MNCTKRGYLRIICSTDYKSARPIKLNIEDRRDLICTVVSMAEHSLHPLEVQVLA